MKSSPEYASTPQFLIEPFELPVADEWESDEDVRAVVELHTMAMSTEGSIESIRRVEVSTEDLLETCDDWEDGQRVFVSRDDEGNIFGMISYYYGAAGAPFLESVAVDPRVQNTGAGSQLINTALQAIRDENPDAKVAYARAQARVVEIYERHWGATIVDTDPKTGQAKISIPL